MSQFSNIIRPANAIPRWPFTINRQSEQARGLVGCWHGGAPFGATWLESINQNNGTVNLTDGWAAAGAIGSGQSSIYLSGTGGREATFPASTPDLIGDWTIAGWANFESLTSQAVLWARWVTERQLAIYRNGSGTITIDIPFVAAIFTISVSLAVDTDYHWAVTRSGNSWTGFLNGQAAGSTTNATAQSASFHTVEIGGNLGGNLTCTPYRATEVRAYNRALSAPEVWALYDPATRYELYQPLSRRVYSIPFAGAGDQTAVLPLLEAANTLYEPTVVPATLTLTLPRIEATETIYAPTVSAGAVTAVLPAISADGAAYAPTVAPAIKTETLPFISADGSLYTPTVVEAGAIADLPQLAANGAFYSPTIIFDQTMTLPQLTAAGAFYAPSVVENLAAGIRLTTSNAPVLNLTLADASVLTLTVSDDLAEG